MAGEKKAKKNVGGRPPKAGTATTKLISVRLTDEDFGLLSALQAHEQQKADALGITLSPADALRIALRREVKRRGLDPAALRIVRSLSKPREPRCCSF